MKNQQLYVTLLACLFISQFLFANTEKYRIMWRDNPATSMVIGWNQIDGNNATVHYGTIDHGTNWASYANSQTVDRSVTAYNMNNQFVRLSGLTPNTVYYFVIKDSNSNSDRFWFKTTSDNNNEKFVFVAGGDSRNNQTQRQNANKIVRSLRPHAVLFGGDYTSTNTNQQWNDWFDDWQFTIGSDGRMIPIVATRGNHESSNTIIVNLFDVAAADNYYKTNFGDDLLSVYTLNTEISIGGNQTTWLDNELNNDQAKFKIAQYHKPVRSHTSGKAEGVNQYNNWVPLFDQYGVDLVVECDSHTGKSTWPITASSAANADEGFIRDDLNGVVYVGEGCWGAPLRTNDDDKSWTRNSGMFNQVKWIFVDSSKIEVRTINTDNANSVAVVNDNDLCTAPANLNIWNPSNGDVITILDNDIDLTGSIELHNFESCNSTNIGDIPNDLSGLTYNPNTETLFGVLNNNPESIHELSLDGAHLRTITLAGFNDTEGIVYMGNNEYAVTEEQVGKVIFITIPDNGADMTINYPANSEIISMSGVWSGNDGLEGIAYDEKEDVMYLLKERTPMEIYKIENPLSKKGTTQNLMLPFDIVSLSASYPPIGGFTDAAGLAVTDESKLLIVSQEGQSLVEVDPVSGQLLSSLDLSPMGLLEAEGVTYRNSAQIFIVGEPNEFLALSKHCGLICETVSSGLADAEEEEGNGNLYHTSSDIELVNDGGRGDQTIGLEFSNLNIPAGSIITSAYIQFTSDNANSNTNPCNLEIRADISDEPKAIEAISYDISSRDKTMNSVAWSPPTWTQTLLAGPNQLTPDLKSIVQEIMDANANRGLDKMVFVISGTGRRTAASYNQNADYGPQLCIEYEIPACLCEDGATSLDCNRSSTASENINRWVGGSSGDWFGDFCNWSKGCFPTQCDDVIIDLDDAQITIQNGEVASCYNLQLSNNAELTVKSAAVLNVLEQ